jgi:hypothetical protein
MATTKMTADEKMITVIVIGGMIFMAAWSGYAAIRIFNGAMPNLSHAGVPLTVISVFMTLLTIVTFIVIRKTK